MLARWHRQSTVETFFLTGTDEHGEKIAAKAAESELSPQAYVDRIVQNSWEPLLETLSITNDDFIRTTQRRHIDGVQSFLSLLHDAGYIRYGVYEGFYCVDCEESKQASDLQTLNQKKLCAIHGTEVKIVKEPNYFFALSQFKEQLLALYEQNPEFIQPASARNEVLAFINNGLEDLSISRTNVKWGIPVPWDSEHVIYVWFDALLNYITGIGYDGTKESLDSRWPAVHLVGKDILRFHAVIWPALLLAAGLPLPEKIIAHGWLLADGKKISKSQGNGVDVNALVEKFGSDALRYYLIRAIPLGKDGNYSQADFEAKYQADLANDFGNLPSRIIALAHKFCDSKVPSQKAATQAEYEVQRLVSIQSKIANEAIERFALHEAIAATWTIIESLNVYLNSEAPWTLGKNAGTLARAQAIIGVSLEALRAVTVLLSPIIPAATEKLWSSIADEATLGKLEEQDIRDAGIWGQLAIGQKLNPLEPLFPRLAI